jgi:hypothetical protein
MERKVIPAKDLKEGDVFSFNEAHIPTDYTVSKDVECPQNATKSTIVEISTDKGVRSCSAFEACFIVK